MAIGRVIKFYNSFFFVRLESELLPCKLRGKMKRDKKTGSAVCPGDFVEISRLKDGAGVIEKVLPRKSLMLRPLVANVDRVILTFAAAEPELHPLLLNRFIALAEWSKIGEIIICVNKNDLSREEKILSGYEKLYKVIRVSALNGDGILKGIISQGVTVFAGPSGVGKSSVLNAIDKKLSLKVGKISEKILRGKHTTRISELLEFGDGFLIDTPGFSAVDLIEAGIDKENLRQCFKEFGEFSKECKFLSGCSHTHEPICGVKNAVAEEKILRGRYDAYVALLGELN